jgi:hypothetical protein
LTFFTAFGLTLGVVTIIRTGIQRTQVTQTPRPMTLTQAPPSPSPLERPWQAAAIPSAPAEPAPPGLVKPAQAPPAFVQRIRDPFTTLLRRSPQDEALDEATKAYTMMEVAMRNAATALPASEPSAPPSSLIQPD